MSYQINDVMMKVPALRRQNAITDVNELNLELEKGISELSEERVVVGTELKECSRKQEVYEEQFKNDQINK